MSLAASHIAKPGFDDHVTAAQQCFRTLLNALSRPGIIEEISLLPPNIEHECPVSADAMAGFLAIALSLCDADTNIWLDDGLQCPELKQHLRFHCASPLVSLPEKATFAFVSLPAQMPSLAAFCQGSAAYPDTSTTLVIACPFALTSAESAPYTLSGPGIKAGASPLRLPLQAQGLPASFWGELQENHAAYPLGVDCIFVNSTVSAHTTVGAAQILALPRSVKLNAI